MALNNDKTGTSVGAVLQRVAVVLQRPSRNVGLEIEGEADVELTAVSGTWLTNSLLLLLEQLQGESVVAAVEETAVVFSPHPALFIAACRLRDTMGGRVAWLGETLRENALHVTVLLPETGGE